MTRRPWPRRTPPPTAAAPNVSAFGIRRVVASVAAAAAPSARTAIDGASITTSRSAAGGSHRPCTPVVVPRSSAPSASRMLVHAASAARPKNAVSRACTRRRPVRCRHARSAATTLRTAHLSAPALDAATAPPPPSDVPDAGEHRRDGVGHRRKRRSDCQRDQRHQEHVLDEVLPLVVPEQPCNQCPHVCPLLHSGTTHDPARHHGGTPPESVIGCKSPEAPVRARTARVCVRSPPDAPLPPRQARCQKGDDTPRPRPECGFSAVDSRRGRPSRPRIGGLAEGADPPIKVCAGSDYSSQLDDIPRVSFRNARASPPEARPRRRRAMPRGSARAAPRRRS